MLLAGVNGYKEGLILKIAIRFGMIGKAVPGFHADKRAILRRHPEHARRELIAFDLEAAAGSSVNNGKSLFLAKLVEQHAVL